MIQVESLRKSFDDHIAVDGVSFEISRGETFGLLGPNGAGKTTTLSILTGLLHADAGQVLIDGRSPADAATRSAIGIAPQTVSLYEEFTAEENLSFFARLYDYQGSALRERVDWALEFAGLTDRRRNAVRTFSGGMKRRLNMACAMVHEPDVILLDEPTVGVDPQSRNHIFDRIEQLRADRRTIIYTTHYMEEAQRLCDRVGIMDSGRILAIDRVEALIRQHGGQSFVDAELLEIPADMSVLPVPPDEARRLRFPSDAPLEQVVSLVESGVKLAELQIRRPDLECVFLNLTGRSLRDE